MCKSSNKNDICVADIRPAACCDAREEQGRNGEANDKNEGRKVNPVANIEKMDKVEKIRRKNKIYSLSNLLTNPNTLCR